jgi:hypothetical protein
VGHECPYRRAQIEAAHRNAVASALRRTEREVALLRRKTNGVVRYEKAKSLLAAEFVHTSSRLAQDQEAGGIPDPQLHSHLLLFAAERKDGKLAAIESKQLYRSARENGAWYRAELAHNLAQLGLQHSRSPPTSTPPTYRRSSVERATPHGRRHAHSRTAWAYRSPTSQPSPKAPHAYAKATKTYWQKSAHYLPARPQHGQSKTPLEQLSNLDRWTRPQPEHPPNTLQRQHAHAGGNKNVYAICTLIHANSVVGISLC